MNSAYINYIATYLPETIVPNKELIANNPSWDENKVFDKLGFKERRVSKDQEFTSDLGVKAVELLQNKTSLDNVDFILYCTQSPDYLIPSNAFLLHQHFNFKKNVGALDFNLGCSGYVYGLGLAKGLISSGQAKNVLLVTSETYTKLIAPEDISNRLIFGDGASATLISDTPTNDSLRINNSCFGTDGSGWDKLKSGIGGLRRFKNPEAPELNLKMNGQEVLLFTLREVPEVARNLLEANKLINPSDIHHYVFHQANKFVIDQISKKMKLDHSLIRNKMENCANTVSSTIPIVLEDLLETDSIKNGELIALIGFGVGFSWAGTLLSKN